MKKQYDTAMEKHIDIRVPMPLYQFYKQSGRKLAGLLRAYLWKLLNAEEKRNDG